MLSEKPVVRSARKASTASKINELVHNLRSKKPQKKTCRKEDMPVAFVMNHVCARIATLKKGGCRSCPAMRLVKMARPHTAAHSSTHDRQGET